MSTEELKIILPAGLMSPADVRRLRRSASSLADYLQQLKLKNSDEPLPKPSTGLLADFAAANDLNLAKIEDCRQTVTLLTELEALAPVMHISFAKEPSAGVMHRITDWFRKNVHPLTLITVGLQPSMGAGCYLRTTNRYFDLSLRRHLLDGRGLLMAKLEELAK